MRSVANSRVRCATVIESVLKMTNAPTKSAIPAKESRKYRMIVVNVAISLDCSSASSTPVRTVTSPPSSDWIRCASCSGVVPSAAAA